MPVGSDRLWDNRKRMYFPCRVKSDLRANAPIEGGAPLTPTNDPGRLLQDLADALGLLYLSDLHTPRYRVSLLRMLENVPATQYSDAEWRAAQSYILCGEAAAGEAPRDHLLRGLREMLRKNP